MKNSDDDLFRPRVGISKSRGNARHQAFLKRVLKQAHASGKGVGKVRYSKRSAKGPGAGLGRGHTAARLLGASLTPKSRRAAVKARIVRFKVAASNTTALHLRYIRRDAVGRDGERGQLYSAREDAADGQDFERLSQADRHQFRFIVSPEDAADIGDLKAFTREFVRRMESDLGTRLEWVAADHWDTDNPHTHLVVRGKTETGEDLIISREYLSEGMRLRTAELSTEWLGERTTREIQESFRRQMAQERWTQLDQMIKVHAREGTFRLDEFPRSGLAATDRARTQVIGRLYHLSSMGLARHVEWDCWELAPDLEVTLRALGERGDVIRAMHRATGRASQECRMATPDLATPVVGRVASKGLIDELHDRGYLIVDGLDGHAHYITLPARASLADFPAGSIVRVQSAGFRQVDATIARVAREGIYRVSVHEEMAASSGQRTDGLGTAHVRRLEALRRAGIAERLEDGVWQIPKDLIEQGRSYDRQSGGLALKVESYVPLSQQVRAVGATWLDRMLVGCSEGMSNSGFAADVRSALEERAATLMERGLASRQGQRLVLMQNLLATLKATELNRVGAAIESETHLSYRPLIERQTVSGIYSRSLMLSSGRFALLEDRAGFSLVPWRTIIEPRLGQALSATVDAGHVSWELGRTRNLSR